MRSLVERMQACRLFDVQNGDEIGACGVRGGDGAGEECDGDHSLVAITDSIAI